MLPHERELLRELVRTFEARLVRNPDAPRCRLCRRQRADLVVDKDGLFWCPRPQRKHCNQLAYSRVRGHGKARSATTWRR
jgi:hypothetical protein